MKSKEKFQPVHITSREAMTATINRYVADRVEHASLTLSMESEIAEIQKRYQRELDELGRRIGAAEAGIHVWAQQHRDDEFPRERKSIELQLATVGFRETPYRVEKARSKDTWGEIALRMASYEERAGEQLTFRGEDYVVYSDPDLSKKLLLQDRARIPASALKAVGIRFEFDENFYIDVKSEVLAGVKREGAAA